MSDAPKQQPLSILSIQAGPLTLRGWVVIILIGLTAFYYFKSRLPDISNAQYIQRLIDKGAMARTAGALIRDARPKAPKDQSAADKAASEAKWKKIANDLSACLETQAKSYLNSGDPFLQKKLTRQSPNLIATRLLTACDAMKYIPKKKK